MYKKIIVLILAALFLTSCSTDKKDSNSFSFKSNNIPGMEITGVIAAEDGNDILYITQVRLFSNWAGGWTEGFYEASGKYVIEKQGTRHKLTEIDPFELWDITAGEIRYNNTYYRGDDGLWKVKNRVDRLKELARVLQDEMGFNKFSANIKEDLFPTLFPEIKGFEKLEEEGKLPAAFYETNEEPETLNIKGYKWRKDYTKAVFPEVFWELRDSGTLYRDVSEAPDIFKALYNLKQFFNRKEFII